MLEFASTGMLNERSDVYSFGVLIMEIISGRNPVDYARHANEVRLKYLMLFPIVFNTTCDPNTKHTVSSSKTPQAFVEYNKIIFTYDVTFWVLHSVLLL